MKRLLNISKKIITFVCLTVAVIAMAGCKKDKKPTVNHPANVTITMTAETNQIKFGEEVSLNITVTGSKNTSYTVKVTENGKEVDYAIVENNKLKVVKEVVIDKFITVTATADADHNKSATKTFTVKAPIIDGQVGELTTALLQEAASQNITVTGTVTDIHTDVNNSRNSYQHEYEMTVKMEQDKWFGTWNPKSNPNAVTMDTYYKGSKDGVTDQYGNTGHTMEYEYINKNNELTRELVKDYASVPAVWEAQHLWNHLGQLNVNKFTYDAENEVYKYNPSGIDDDYLLTYIAVSFTPMLASGDTLVDFYLRIENGKITQILGQTTVLYNGTIDVKPQDADTVDYTTVALTLSDLGTTKIDSIKEFDAPQNADKLQAAFDNMATQTNYTFDAAETQTQAPTTDDSDYEMQTTSAKARVKRAIGLHNYTSSTGRVGVYGQITEDAIVYERTTKYSYTMDGKDYKVEYTGFKKISDTAYDAFTFNSAKSIELDATVFEGTRRYNGKITDQLPKFDLSANIFEFVSTVQLAGGETGYKFKLRDQLITRAVALEVSAHPYATDGSRDNQVTLTVTVDSNGHVIQTVYPYSLNIDTYVGYITTNYSNFGTTEIMEGTFDNYIERVVRTSWSQYDVKYYYPNFSNASAPVEATADVVFKQYLDYDKLPSPTVFMNVFGDDISGPFFDWKNMGTETEPDNHMYLSITVRTDICDENLHVSDEDFQVIKTKLDEEMQKAGYVLDLANTDITGGTSGRSDYYLCYVRGNTLVMVQTNHTRNFWIYFYKVGDWNLSRN